MTASTANFSHSRRAARNLTSSSDIEFLVSNVCRSFRRIIIVCLSKEGLLITAACQPSVVCPRTCFLEALTRLSLQIYLGDRREIPAIYPKARSSMDRSPGENIESTFRLLLGEQPSDAVISLAWVFLLLPSRCCCLRSIRIPCRMRSLRPPTGYWQFHPVCVST